MESKAATKWQMNGGEKCGFQERNVNEMGTIAKE